MVLVEMTTLWEEYEAQKTPESKAVRDLDKFDMLAQAHEYEEELKEPRKLQEFFDSTSGQFQTETVKKWVAELERERNHSE